METRCINMQMTHILSYRPPTATPERLNWKNIEQWAQANNLKLNRANSLEIIFQNNRRQIHTDLPPTLPEIARTTAIKMLGVTVTNHLSVSEHVRDVISRCAQSIYALKLLRSHGMNDDELRTIYKSVVLAKLLYAMPAQGGVSPRRMTRDDSKRSFDGASG